MDYVVWAHGRAETMQPVAFPVTAKTQVKILNLPVGKLQYEGLFHKCPPVRLLNGWLLLRILLHVVLVDPVVFRA